MVRCSMEISKEVYDRAVTNKGHITRDDEREIFDVSILCGYGLYGTEVEEENGKYYCHYWRGSTCD